MSTSADQPNARGTDRDHDGVPDRKEVVARQQDEHGGIKWGSAFFGWLTAAGTAILVTALLSAIGTAVGLGALSGPDISEEEHEVVLSEERPVVGKTAEPVERVRLGTETVTDEETVTEEVRKEHIETDGDVAGDLNDGVTHDRDRDRR